MQPPPFTETRKATTVATPEGWTLSFRFDVPITAPPSIDDAGMGGYYWQLEFKRTGVNLFSSPPRCPLELTGPSAEELQAIGASESSGQEAAIAVAADFYGRPLLPHERMAVPSLSAAELEQARQQTRSTHMAIKWIGGCFLMLFAIPIALIIVSVVVGMITGKWSWRWSYP